jgi:hypothetical protein
MKRCPDLLDCWAAWRASLGGFSRTAGRLRPWPAAAHRPSAWSWPPQNGPHGHTGHAPRRCRRGWPRAPAAAGCRPRAGPSRRGPGGWPWGGAAAAQGASAFVTSPVQGAPLARGAAARRAGPPAVARPLVTLAGERPARLGRSRAPWDGRARAQPLAREGRGEHLRPDTGRRLRAQPGHAPRGAPASGQRRPGGPGRQQASHPQAPSPQVR